MSGQFELGSKHIECMKLAKQNLSEVQSSNAKEAAKEMLAKTYGFLPSESHVYDDYLGLTTAIEEIAKTLPEVASILADQVLVKEIFKTYGNDKFSAFIGANETIAVLCSESGINSISNISTKAIRNNGQWSINGKKQISSDQLSADKFLVFAQDEEGLIRLFVLSSGQITINKLDKSIASATIKLNQAEISLSVGDNALAATVNDEFEYIQTIARTLIAAVSVGIAHSALLTSIGVAKEVKNSEGQSISTSQNMQFTLADMFAEIEASRMLAYYSANSIDENKASIKLATMAKVKASDIAAKASVDTLHILGNIGYIANADFAGIIAKAVETQAKGGTNRTQMAQIYQYMLAKK